MKRLPIGWTLAAVEDLIEADGLFFDGDWVESKDQDPDGTVRLTQLADVGEGHWRDRSHRYMTSEAAHRLRCTTLEIGDVLVARMPDPLGRACQFPGDPMPAVTVVDVAVIRPGGRSVRSDWLMWAINAPQMRQQIEALQSGTTRRRISRRNLGSVRLPVPPKQEQARIVVAIEEAFSKLDAGEASLHTTRQLLKRMRESILTAAVTGKLLPQDPTDTAIAGLLDAMDIERLDLPDLQRLPKSWVWVSLGGVAEVGTGSTPKRGTKRFWESGTVPWITSALLNRPVVQTASQFVTQDAVKEVSLRKWAPGTVLLAMYGEGKTRGKSAVLEIEATCNQACAAIRLRDETVCSVRYLRLVLDASYESNRRLASGGVQPNLNLGLVRGIAVALPPAEEQARIVEEVERQSSFLEACERAVDRGLSQSAALRRSVLRAAFEGLLVPQDPTDEPASVVLERIKSERAAAPKKPTRGRKVAS